MKVEKIGHYSMTNPASIFDEDAMTALELAGRTAGKVNEIVDAVNGQDATINDAVSYMKQNIKQTTEKEIETLCENGTMESFLNLGVLESIKSDLAGKASVAQIQALASGSPKGVFRSVVDLEASTANKNYTYVVSADNGWYYHNGTSWTRGGDYLSPVGAAALPGNSIAFKEIILTGDIYFDSDTNILTIPKSTYYCYDNANYQIGTRAITTEHVVDLSAYPAALKWVVYDIENDTTHVLRSVDSWVPGYRVIIAFLNGEFYGVNKPCIKHTEQFTKAIKKSMLPEVNHGLKHGLLFKFLGDSITAGSGATGYALTTNPLYTGSGNYEPNQDSPCWANNMGKYLVEKALSKYTVFTPNSLNVKISGAFLSAADFPANNKVVGGMIARYYDTLTFTFHGNGIVLNFWCYDRTGLANIYVDGNLHGTLDTSSTETSGEVKLYNITGLTNDEHTIKIVCSGLGINNAPGTQARLAFGGGTISKDVEYKNNGVSGQRANYANFYKDKLITGVEDVVFIAFGTNDRGMDSLEHIIEDLTKTIEYAYSLGVAVVLLTPIPHPTEENNYKHKIIDVVGIIKEVAERKQTYCIDMYHKMLDYCASNNVDINTLYKDGLHPNDAGYAVMTALVKDALMV